jgi:hypothetical protein
MDLARRVVSLLAGAAALVLVTGVQAAPPTKEECLEAHGKGQDLREQRQLARARVIFQVCAANTCPALVQADCARFSDELSKVVPSLSFAARDERQVDLPNTMVYVDDLLMTSRLDEGRSFDVDPGKHTVRFVHEGREVTLKVVVNQGEKGRPIVATFGGGGSEPSVSAGGAGEPRAASAPAAPEPRRPLTPLFVAGAGLVAAGIGTALIFVGAGKVPSNCSISSKECAAPPGDKSFDEAHSGVATMNTGIAVGVIGAITVMGSLVWYFLQTPTVPKTAEAAHVGPDWTLRF